MIFVCKQSHVAQSKQLTVKNLKLIAGNESFRNANKAVQLKDKTFQCSGIINSNLLLLLSDQVFLVRSDHLDDLRQFKCILFYL